MVFLWLLIPLFLFAPLLAAWIAGSKEPPVDIRLELLGSTFKKSDPACGSCHYDAEWILRLGTLEKLFCERCLVDALLDAMNFSCVIPNTP